MNTSEVIKDQLEDLGLTQSWLGEQLGLTKQAISHMLKTPKSMSIERFEQIQTLLETERSKQSVTQGDVSFNVHDISFNSNKTEEDVNVAGVNNFSNTQADASVQRGIIKVMKDQNDTLRTVIESQNQTIKMQTEVLHDLREQMKEHHENAQSLTQRLTEVVKILERNEGLMQFFGESHKQIQELLKELRKK